MLPRIPGLPEAGFLPFEQLTCGLIVTERTDPGVWDEWDRLTGGTVVLPRRDEGNVEVAR